MDDPAEGLVIRVKRRRSQDPVDLLLVQKRPKRPLLEALEGLSLAPPVKYAFKRKEFPVSIQPPTPSDFTELRSQAAAEARLELKLRHRVIDFQLEEIQCNGVSVKLCVPTTTSAPDTDYIIDEYFSEKYEPDYQTSRAFISVADLLEPRVEADLSDNSHDSEDSNAEDRPENDYPEEEEFDSEKSSESRHSESSDDEYLY
jgi:hypothetical protein